MEIASSDPGAQAVWLERAGSALRRFVSWRAAGLVALAAGLYAFVSLLTFTTEPGVFASPDETAHYLMTRTFGEDGQLYYTREYAAEDDIQLLRPRAIWQYEDRLVLPNSQGLPFTYGLGYRLMGDNVVYLALALAPLCLFFLYETAALLTGRRSLLLAAAVFGAGPLLYWFSHPYWNSLGSTAFFAGGLYFLVRYWQESRLSQLVWCGAFFSLSMLFRYEYPVFLAPFVGITLYFKHGREQWRTLLRDYAFFGVTTLLLFLVPVVAFSEHVYDKPLVFPTAFQRESAQAGSFGFGFLGTILGLTGKALIPQGFDPWFVVQNLARFTVMLVPAFTLAAAGGLALALRRGLLQRRFLIAGAGLLLYYIFFVGSVSSTNSATGLSPTYEASIVRYWLLLYVAMFFFAGYLLVSLPELVKERWAKLAPALTWTPSIALVIVLAASTVPMVWFSWSGSLSAQQRAGDFGMVYVDRIQGTEDDAIIYSLPAIHKYTAAERDVAFVEGLPAPRGSLEVPYEMTAEESWWVNFMAWHFGYANGYAPVYLIETQIDVYSLLGALRGRGYTLEEIEFGVRKLVPYDESQAYEWRVRVETGNAFVYAVPTERDDDVASSGVAAWAASLARTIVESPQPFTPKYVLFANLSDANAMVDALAPYDLTLVSTAGGLLRVAPVDAAVQADGGGPPLP